mgnify:CR=1 FL=1
MKALSRILFVAVLMVFVASSAFAPETTGEKESAPPPSPPAMGGGEMMSPMRPMMQGMMGGGMMCPMMQKMMGRMPMMGGPNIMDFAEKLKLTDEQKDKIKAILVAHMKDMINKRAELETAEIDLKELMDKEEPDLNTLERQIQKIAMLEATMKLSQIKTMLDAKAILTPEQKATLKEIMKEKPSAPMMMHMGKIMERMREGHRWGRR